MFLDQKKKLKQLRIEYSDILKIFLNMKKKKFLSTSKSTYFGVTITLNIKAMAAEMKQHQLKNILIDLDHI